MISEKELKLKLFIKIDSKLWWKQLFYFWKLTWLHERNRGGLYLGGIIHNDQLLIKLFKLYKSYCVRGLHICVPLAARLCYSFKCSGSFSFFLSFLALINIGSTLCLHQRSKSTVNPMAYYIVHFYGHDLQARTLALLHL